MVRRGREKNEEGERGRKMRGKGKKIKKGKKRIYIILSKDKENMERKS